MNTYHINVTSSDTMGFAWIENIIQLANIGAVMKPGTIPYTRFPHSLSMVLEAEVPPTPTATMHVFEVDSNRRVHATLDDTIPLGSVVAPAPTVAAVFSMNEDGDDDIKEDEEEVEETTEEGEKDLSTNDEGQPWSREDLDAMTWDQVKAVGKAVGVTGRDREKVIKGYLAAVSAK